MRNFPLNYYDVTTFYRNFVPKSESIEKNCNLGLTDCTL
jgi:hypothetical protein